VRAHGRSPRGPGPRRARPRAASQPGQNAEGVHAGLGELVFDKLDANLAKALMSIGAVKTVEIGACEPRVRRNAQQRNERPPALARDAFDN
jgi:hypothetical protein